MPDAKRSLGQNFLVDRDLIKKILEKAGFGQEDQVVELGVGLGHLTRELARQVKRVIGIEIDQSLIDWIIENAPLPQNVELRKADMLEIDLSMLSKQMGGPVKLIGNLPYNIASQLLFRLFSQSEYISVGVFMFQKEVADRIMATPGTKRYGILSVLCSYYFHVERLMDISPGAFRPRPKVYSTVLRLSPREPEVAAIDQRFFKNLVKAAFQMRRKKLVNTLKPLVKSNKKILEAAFFEIGIYGDMRPEQLAPVDFVRLSNKLLFHLTDRKMVDKSR